MKKKRESERERERTLSLVGVTSEEKRMKKKRESERERERTLSLVGFTFKEMCMQQKSLSASKNCGEGNAKQNLFALTIGRIVKCSTFKNENENEIKFG